MIDVPAGYKLVPIEPTYQMLRAASESSDCMVDVKDSGASAASLDHDEARQVWKAMLAAVRATP